MELLKPRCDLRALALLSALGAACVPDVDTDESTITEPRVIAVQAEPAEAPAGANITYTALFVDASGRLHSGDLSWFYCNAQKPLAELGPVSQECLQGASGKLSRFGSGLTAQGQVPDDVCSIFGPNPPLVEGDEDPGRPVDPDQTGGYSLPTLLGIDSGSDQDVVLYEQRVACGLAAVAPKIAVDFAQRYHANQNPAVKRVVATVGGDSRELFETDVLEVEPGATVAFSAQWPACPASDKCGDGVCGPEEGALDCAKDCETPIGCRGSERYVWYDTQQRELTIREESMRVAWYATAGTYENERTGIDEGAPAHATENWWTAPRQEGTVHLWVVLRDARGGVGFRGVTVRVR